MKTPEFHPPYYSHGVIRTNESTGNNEDKISLRYIPYPLTPIVNMPEAAFIIGSRKVPWWKRIINLLSKFFRRCDKNEPI